MKNNDSSASPKKIIAIVGMAGSGKSEVGAFFKEKGLPVLRFGDVIDEGLRAEGKEWSAENNTYYREKIRQESGMAAVAITMLPKIKQAVEDHQLIVLDGLYSWEEYTYLKKEFEGLFLLAVYASPEIRYKRLAERNDRPFSLAEAEERDKREIEQINKGGPIAMANYLIKNEASKDALIEELAEFWQGLNK